MCDDLLSKKQVVHMLDIEVQLAGSQELFAARHYFTASVISLLLRGHTSPGPCILKALGLEKVVFYRRVKDGK